MHYCAQLTITPTPTQQKWLETQVATGLYPSVEDSVRAAEEAAMPLADTDFSGLSPISKRPR